MAKHLVEERPTWELQTGKEKELGPDVLTEMYGAVVEFEPGYSPAPVSWHALGPRGLCLGGTRLNPISNIQIFLLNCEKQRMTHAPVLPPGLSLAGVSR